METTPSPTATQESTMFWILHFIALLTFAPALFVTIPLHIIASNQKKGKK